MKGYRYTECGLDNVYLEGVDVQRDDHGDEVYCIENVLGLHKMIAHTLINGHDLTGAELRFLRSEMGLTQEELAKKLGYTRVTVTRWERGDQTIDPKVRLIVRLLAAEKLDIESDMTIEDMMALSTDSSAPGVTIRIDGSDPQHYKPIREAA